ncbi:MAG: hypothetical protein A2099_02770 [Planctomycetes bacterium GWF2_39_10]|nr:MAG: hypothetical protein A2099_02770 [Planctomycetes bacterium GWF2_39_10]
MAINKPAMNVSQPVAIFLEIFLIYFANYGRFLTLMQYINHTQAELAGKIKHDHFYNHHGQFFTSSVSTGKMWRIFIISTDRLNPV